MNRTGHRGKVDANHQEILEGLRQSKAGIAAVSIASVGGGIPDILAGFRGVNLILEVKQHGELLTAAEVKFHETWPGQREVVETTEQAIEAILRHAKECGRV